MKRPCTDTRSSQRKNKKRIKSTTDAKHQRNTPFKIILVDIKKSNDKRIKCVKKDMYDTNLKYIVLSYGYKDNDQQLQQQQQHEKIETPDYTAYITSFKLWDLKRLCHYIRHEIDLKKIRYLWIDAISIPQYKASKKKSTMLQMKEIYQRATSILAVPDLHLGYLYQNPTFSMAINYIMKYKKTIYNDLLERHSGKTSQFPYNFLSYTAINDEVRSAYIFLAYVIHTWSRCTWVISQCEIAKEKYEQFGIPLKYIFLSLLTDFNDLQHYLNEFNIVNNNNNNNNSNNMNNDNNNDNDNKNNITDLFHFFSLTFNHHSTTSTNKKIGENNMTFKNVNNPKKLARFIETSFRMKEPLEMILYSWAAKNEDKFYAFLPLWEKYRHLLKDISNWHITDKISVQLKLYEIMDDLWEKAKLLFIYANDDSVPTCPTFACPLKQKQSPINIIEKENSLIANNNYMKQLRIAKKGTTKLYKSRMKTLIKKYKTRIDGSIFEENLIDIQYHPDLNYLHIQTIIYFIIEFNNKKMVFDPNLLTKWSLKNDDTLEYIYIPFFIYKEPCDRIPPLHSFGASGIFLLGNRVKNRWILLSGRFRPILQPIYKLSINSNGFNVY
ncbi:unnamed protein product [Cunninghamella blakesleeana]